MSQSVKGVLTSVSKFTSGSNPRGDWSVQVLTVKNGSESEDVKVWCRPDFTSAKGKWIEIDGVTPGKGKNKAGSEIDILELKAGAGNATVKDLTGRATAPTKTTAPDTRRTIDEYFEVLDTVIRHVRDTFNSPGTIVPDQQAIAHVVNGTMVAFARGEFVVEKDINPEDPIVI